MMENVKFQYFTHSSIFYSFQEISQCEQDEPTWQYMRVIWPSIIVDNDNNNKDSNKNMTTSNIPVSPIYLTRI